MTLSGVIKLNIFANEECHDLASVESGAQVTRMQLYNILCLYINVNITMDVPLFIFWFIQFMDSVLPLLV